MRRFACLMMAALAGATVPAQGLLDCIEPDVLHALLLPGLNGRAPVLTVTVPPELSALKMPGELTWIGSAERPAGRIDVTTNAVQVTAAWRSTLAPDAAQAAAVAALTASGWVVRPVPGMGRAMFIPPVVQFGPTACRDGRAVNVSAGAMDGTTYVLLNLQRGSSEATPCSVPERAPAAVGSAMDPYLPRLEVPADAATGTAARIGSIGSSFGQSAVSSTAEIVSTDSATAIARIFARQLVEQGWSNDATWNGSSTAGSTWIRRSGDGTRIQATLSVMNVDGQRNIAVFRVTAPQ